MSTGIIIALIICATIVIVTIIGGLTAALNRKQVTKQLDKFNEAFPTAKRNNNNDDLPKFGDF